MSIKAMLAPLTRNRFLPCPPPELTFCGDGDFRAIGAEFLGHFITLGGLAPEARVLDLGCGIGRMAVPLTQYLSDDGSYVGLDVSHDGIAWCERHITPVYPNFRFQHVDFHHPLYNPAGARRTGPGCLGLADGSFDFILLISVLTHLDEDGLRDYAAECARLLAPGGVLFATAFLLNPPARTALRSGGGRIAIDPDTARVGHADPQAPLAAVAFDEDLLVEAFLRHGLLRDTQVTYGHWSGRERPNFQDICIFRKQERAS